MTLDDVDIIDEEDTNTIIKGADIRIIGIGGGGGNAVNRMMEQHVSEDIIFIAANTDQQALQNCHATKKLVLGRNLTHGLGAGGKPEIGEKAALEDKDAITNAIGGADMVFITAGMGGGTGTGGAPVVAQISKNLGILTVAIVTTPFVLEGKVKAKYAQDGIARLRENVDALIIVPNENLLINLDAATTMVEAFLKADDVLRQGILGISTLITGHGRVNIDFADVDTIMRNKGVAIMGVGDGHGESKAVDAIQNAIYNKVLEDADISGATGILVGITSGEDLTINEFQTILKMAKETADPEVLFTYGWKIDEEMKDKVSVTIIATGFNHAKKEQEPETAEPEVKMPNVISAQEWDKLQHGGVTEIKPVKAELVQEEDTPVDVNNKNIPALLRYRGQMNFPKWR
ncbi:MAG: cell division protein FtsZ [Spirochaetia bacterium]|nr:cell division protein FtsZ [Spirochaetia bacterium]